MSPSLDEQFPNLRACIDSLVQAMQPVKVILFGSHARGDAHIHSDLDFLIIIDRIFGPNQTRMGAFREAYKIFDTLHYPKDLLIFNKQEYETWQTTRHHVIGQAVLEGHVLYER